MNEQLRYTLEVVIEVDALDELGLVTEVVEKGQEYGTVKVVKVELLPATEEAP